MASDMHKVNKMFTICSDNKDCVDFNGCTTDFCNPVTRTCENREENDCVDCSWLTLQLTLDNYPDESGWYIQHVNNTERTTILNGNPYTDYSLGLSRNRSPGRKNKGGRKNNGGRKNKNARKNKGGRKHKNARKNKGGRKNKST